jgi:6-phosphogluconolactonase/glucosamine-6-phosphate isomerase/deaminase
MLFILSEDWQEAINAIASRLTLELQTKSVLWLVSGGSQLEANCLVMQAIPDNLTSGLSIMPIDERYGNVGHPDSNWASLMNAGFSPKQARLLPVLVDNLSFDQTAERFNIMAGQAFSACDVLIGQLGIGTDGHTAGILPGSPAAQESQSLVAYYEAPPLKRLTLTYTALRRLNVAFALAYGETKRQALTNLKQNLPLSRQPAQVIKDIKEAYVYNDQVGEDNA